MNDCTNPGSAQEAYEDGAYIVRQGEPGDTMFVVQTGDVIATHRVTGEPGDGQEVGRPELCLYTPLQCVTLPICLLSVCVVKQATCDTLCWLKCSLHAIPAYARNPAKSVGEHKSIEQ